MSARRARLVIIHANACAVSHTAALQHAPDSVNIPAHHATNTIRMLFLQKVVGFHLATRGNVERPERVNGHLLVPTGPA